MHIRTLPANNYFSRFIASLAKDTCNGFIYITENEKKHMNNITTNINILEKIIYNPVKNLKIKQLRIKNLDQDKRLKIGMLSNFSYNRGIDRVIEVLEAIPFKKRDNFLFIVAGDMKLEKNLPNIPKEFNNKEKDFIDYINFKEYSKYFIFLGRVDHPEQVINTIDILLKPTRLYNPWGRDILESLSMGKPVISVGTYNKFVETNKTGLLQKEFNASGIVKWLLSINNNKRILNTYKINSIKKTNVFCDPDICALNLIKFWNKIISK